MTDATIPSGTSEANTTAPVGSTTPSKGKGKGKAVDESMDEDEEEEEDDDDDEEEEEDDDDEEDDEDEDESGEKIDPSAIIPRSRRAAAQRVDYSSEEALKKAGLTKAELEKDDDEAMES